MTQHYPLALIADKPHLTGRSIFFCLFCVYLFMWFPGHKLAGWSCVIRQLARVLVWCNVLTYFFPFLSDSGYNAININNWSACGQETFDVKKQNQKKRLVTSVFAWQSSRCDLTITRRIGRNGIPLRSIFARCILLRCWWSKCNCDFKDLGKKKNHCWEKSEDNLIQTRLGSLKKTTKGLTEKVRVIFYASGRSIVISQKLCDVCYLFSLRLLWHLGYLFTRRHFLREMFKQKNNHMLLVWIKEEKYSFGDR